jgi:hypothetical protein
MRRLAAAVAAACVATVGMVAEGGEGAAYAAEGQGAAEAPVTPPPATEAPESATPSPSPSPTPSPSPSPQPQPSPSPSPPPPPPPPPSPSPSPQPSPTPTPSPPPTPTVTPSPSPQPTPTPSPSPSPNDDGDGPIRFSLPSESERASWRLPGFRLELGLLYGEFHGLGGAPSGRLLGPLVRVGVRLDADWSLMASLEYASASRSGGLSGLRFAGLLEPIWNVTPQLSLGVGVGFGGIVEGRTGRPDPEPLGSSLDTSYTFPDASTPLASCSGVGVAGRARVAWMTVLGRRSSTGVALEVDGQWTGCVDDTHRLEPDTAQPIVRRQFWPHLGASLSWVIAWR